MGVLESVCVCLGVCVGGRWHVGDRVCMGRWRVGTWGVRGCVWDVGE